MFRITESFSDEILRGVSEGISGILKNRKIFFLKESVQEFLKKFLEDFRKESLVSLRVSYYGRVPDGNLK